MGEHDYRREDGTFVKRSTAPDDPVRECLFADFDEEPEFFDENGDLAPDVLVGGCNHLMSENGLKSSGARRLLVLSSQKPGSITVPDLSIHHTDSLILLHLHESTAYCRTGLRRKNDFTRLAARHLDNAVTAWVMPANRVANTSSADGIAYTRTLPAFFPLASSHSSSPRLPTVVDEPVYAVRGAVFCFGDFPLVVWSPSIRQAFAFCCPSDVCGVVHIADMSALHQIFQRRLELPGCDSACFSLGHLFGSSMSSLELNQYVRPKQPLIQGLKGSAVRESSVL